MSGRAAAFVIVVASQVCYQIAQRSMPAAARPAALMTFVYGSACVTMLAVAVTTHASGEAVAAPVTAPHHWAPYLLIAAVIGLELGFLAMYRAGWGIGTAGISTHTTASAVLVVVGLTAFGERVTVANAAGIALCAGGAWLVSR